MSSLLEAPVTLRDQRRWQAPAVVDRLLCRPAIPREPRKAAAPIAAIGTQDRTPAPEDPGADGGGSRRRGFTRGRAETRRAAESERLHQYSTKFDADEAKDENPRKHVTLSQGVGFVFDAEVWDVGNCDPLPAAGVCRFIPRHGAAFSCAERSAPGSAYCACHHAVAYRPTNKGRR